MTVTTKRLSELFEDLPKLHYLEIGLARGDTFHAINAGFKVGVDPFPHDSLKSNENVKICSSDQFFSKNTILFDVIFIDGLHTFEQVLRDLLNSLNSIKPGGLVIIDDVYPDSRPSMSRSLVRYRLLRFLELLKNPIRPSVGWQGDVFRLIPVISKIDPELSFRTVVESGEKLQTFIFGQNIGKYSYDASRLSEDFVSKDETWAPKLYERQPKSVLEVDDIFNPVSWSNFLVEFRSSRR
jgi:Methyltransferase domain